VHYCASVPGDVVWLLSKALPERVIGSRFMIMRMLSSRCGIPAFPQLHLHGGSFAPDKNMQPC
jgi:hypothetical protein